MDPTPSIAGPAVDDANVGEHEHPVSREIELKLFVPPSSVERLWSHPLLTELAIGPMRVERIDNRYFDTPERDLARRRMALRLRRIGPALAADAEGRGTRRACDQRTRRVGDADARWPDRRWRSGGCATRRSPSLGASVGAQRLIVRNLRPVFTTNFRRESRLLRLADGSVVEFAFDVGTIAAGRGKVARVLPICEVEIERKSGTTVLPGRGHEDVERAARQARIESRREARSLAATEGAQPGECIGPAIGECGPDGRPARVRGHARARHRVDPARGEQGVARLSPRRSEAARGGEDGAAGAARRRRAARAPVARAGRLRSRVADQCPLRCSRSRRHRCRRLGAAGRHRTPGYETIRRVPSQAKQGRPIRPAGRTIGAADPRAASSIATVTRESPHRHRSCAASRPLRQRRCERRGTRGTHRLHPSGAGRAASHAERVADLSSGREGPPLRVRSMHACRRWAASSARRATGTSS